MVLVTGNWKLWIVGLAVSLGIFLVVFFTVITPSDNTANQALQDRPSADAAVLNQAKKQLRSAATVIETTPRSRARRRARPRRR